MLLIFRDVTFEVNGSQRIIKVKDNKSGVKSSARVKAQPGVAGSVGA
jgi:pyruvate carboxylase